MIKATGTRYIVEPEALETTTAGGIYVKNTGTTQFAIIRSAGPKLKEPLAIGTRVLLDWNSTLPLKHEGVDYYVVENSALHAVVGD
jgi:co-chaperonin GroES (HSP10)